MCWEYTGKTRNNLWKSRGPTKNSASCIKSCVYIFHWLNYIGKWTFFVCIECIGTKFNQKVTKVFDFFKKFCNCFFISSIVEKSCCLSTFFNSRCRILSQGVMPGHQDGCGITNSGLVFLKYCWIKKEICVDECGPLQVYWFPSMFPI